MRTLKRNQQKMFYALYKGQAPIYKLDDEGNIIYDHYEDSDGNWIYYLDENGEKIPLETGEKEIGYTEAIEFFGNIAMSGGEARSEEYGIDVSQYDAILIVPKAQLPIDETSLIWFENEVGYKDNDEIVVDGDTADFRVLAVKPSLNVTKYVLGRIAK